MRQYKNRTLCYGHSRDHYCNGYGYLSVYSFISEPLGLTLGSQCPLETVKSDVLLRTFILYKTAKTEE